MPVNMRRLPMKTLTVALALACASFVALPSTASAVTSAEVQAQADEAYAQLSEMQSTLDQKSDEYYSALAERDAATSAMNDAQAREDAANAKIAELQGHLSERAKDMYKDGQTSLLDVMLGTSSFDDFVSTWDFLNQMNADDATCIAQTKDLEAEAQAARDEYQQQAQVADQKVAEAEQAKADAEQTIASLQTLTASLDAEVASLVSQEQAAASAAVTTTQGGTAAVATSDSGSSDSGSGTSSGGTYEGGSDAVSRAYACLGAPYIWGDAGPDGYDCSGLVSYCITGTHSHVFTSSGLNEYEAVSDPQPGDVCVRSGHCGIYIGGGQYINASDYGIGVIISSVPDDMKIVRP